MIKGSNSVRDKREGSELKSHVSSSNVKHYFKGSASKSKKD